MSLYHDVESINTIVNLYGLNHYFSYFTEWNTSWLAPYHNGYHSLCMLLNCTEAAYHERLTGSETRALLVAALFHDFNHSAGKYPDQNNIAQALVDLQKAHSLASHNLLALSKEEIELAIRCIQVTKYPYEQRPEVLVEKIIRDADLMQPYEENPGRLLQQYLGLKHEIEVLHQRSYTDEEFAEGNDKFLGDVEWHTGWAIEKARVRGWDGVRANLRKILLERN